MPLRQLWEAIVNSVMQLSLLDVVDILLVAYLIYLLLLLAKQTRAMQVIKGLGLLIVTAQVTKLLQLTAVAWILDYVIAAGGLALVVLFQPELRRALEQIGRSKVFDKSILAGSPQGNAMVLMQELLKALLAMSKRRIGALIVIERKTGLNDIIATGTRIHGLVSSMLIENIFEPNTPLHDGAMIIRDDMIEAAACFLPLSENTGISHELGTRHRAALGVSEVSDACVFIVSEETGVISMAREGRLIRYLDADAIEEILKDIFYSGKERTGFFLFRRRQKDEP